MSVAGYGRGCAGAMSCMEGYTLEMGRQDGALCTHLKFRDRYSRAPTGPGIVLGSRSDPSVIFEAGIRIRAVFGAAGIKLVVSRRI